jgi:hypothetical protein
MFSGMTCADIDNQVRLLIRAFDCPLELALEPDAQVLKLRIWVPGSLTRKRRKARKPCWSETLDRISAPLGETDSSSLARQSPRVFPMFPQERNFKARKRTACPWN